MRERNLAAVPVTHDLGSLAPGQPHGVDVTVHKRDDRIESWVEHAARA